MAHICHCCNYTTDKRFNYEKHLKCERHRLIETNQKNQTLITQNHQTDNPQSTQTAEKVTREYACKYCEQKFNFKQSMYRHIKYTCAKKKEIEMEELKDAGKLLNKQQDKLEKMDLIKIIETQSLLIDKLIGHYKKDISLNNI